MKSDQVTDHLQVIRTLMERSAVYRRALAPIMTFAGGIGAFAAVGGCIFQIEASRVFIIYWIVTALIALAGSFLLVRRQALKDAEPFWSPPTRRVAHAIVPPLAAGFIVSTVVFIQVASDELPAAKVVSTLWLPIIWVVLYGCAMCAAGFFTLRGLKLFGWAFILGGCMLFAARIPDRLSQLYYTHGIMGFFFGFLHIAYGAYLYVTEKGKNAS